MGIWLVYPEWTFSNLISLFYEKDDPCHLANKRQNVQTIPNSWMRVKFSLQLTYLLCSLCFYLIRNTCYGILRVEDLVYYIISQIRELTSEYNKGNALANAEIDTGLWQANLVSEKY